MQDQTNFSSVISNLGFRHLWFNQILVQLAYNTLNFALIVWVFRLTHANLAISALMLAIYTPTIIFGLLAGVFVDMVDRRKIILTVDFLLAVAFLMLLLVKQSLVGILVDTFIINSLAQFFMPSESSSIPMLVSRKQLIIANSLFSLTLYAALMAGFTISGPMLQLFGIDSVYIFGGIILFAAFLLSQKLPVIQVQNPHQLARNQLIKSLQQLLDLTFSEARQMLRFIRSKLNVAVAIFLMGVIQGIIGMLAVMMPDYLERVLLVNATDASYFVMLPLGCGMIIGALLLGRYFHGVPRRAVVIPAILAAGVVFILMGIAPTLAHLLQVTEPVRIRHPRYFFMAPSLSFFFGILAFLLGLSMVSVAIPCQTVIQENTPEKDRGKIFAVLGVFMTGVSAIPIILAGGLSDIFGVTPIFVAIGLFVVFIGSVAHHPKMFFHEGQLTPRIKEFLGGGHWDI
ncbi:MFS transporter [Patescibacteria group bacterium]|nr:MFS transporter [Patescibacteria group bacterium]MCL5409396.1 MFS transporter [Patescibacteria group bacterium]